jgi:hypothetical protein
MDVIVKASPLKYQNRNVDAGASKAAPIHRQSISHDN